MAVCDTARMWQSARYGHEGISVIVSCLTVCLAVSEIHSFVPIYKVVLMCITLLYLLSHLIASI